MSESLKENEPLPPEYEIALSYTPADLRSRMRAFFTLDRRLSQIAAQTTEPMLGQMRLAWWREMLQKPAIERPQGDAALDAIGSYWAGRETQLTSLIDGWEALVAAQALDTKVITVFAEGRASPFFSFVDAASTSQSQRIAHAGALWALADAAINMSDEGERAICIQEGLGWDREGRLPNELRGLAILEALALRSLNAGAAPMMEGRGAALLAFKVGLLGR